MFRTLAIATVVTTSIIFVGGCETNPATGKSQLILVDSETTTQMGIEAKPQMIKEYGGEVKSPELREYVAQVGRKLLRHVEPEYANTPWEFITLDSDVINAFALPAGKVFMSRGLLEQLTNEAGVAGVLGHEIGHVTGRHIDERISQSMVVQGLASVGGAFGGEGLASIIPTVIGGVGNGYLLKFGRDQESQADSLGLKYMVKAGYDPMGMADVMRVLIKASEGNDQWEILSTHPDPKRRLEAILAAVEKDYPHTQNNPDFRKFENRFDRDAVPFLNRKTAAIGLGALPDPVQWCGHCRLSTAARVIGVD
jgi:predicted Zn-dependent protease